MGSKDPHWLEGTYSYHSSFYSRKLCVTISKGMGVFLTCVQNFELFWIWLFSKFDCKSKKFCQTNFLLFSIANVVSWCLSALNFCRPSLTSSFLKLCQVSYARSLSHYRVMKWKFKFYCNLTDIEALDGPKR